MSEVPLYSRARRRYVSLISTACNPCGGLNFQMTPVEGGIKDFYKDTSSERKSLSIGPYSRPVPGVLEVL